MAPFKRSRRRATSRFRKRRPGRGVGVPTRSRRRIKKARGRIARIARAVVRGEAEHKVVKYRPFDQNGQGETQQRPDEWVEPTAYQFTLAVATRPKYYGEVPITDTTGQPITSGLVPLACYINTGTSWNDRVGSEITVTRHVLRLKFAVGDAQGNYCRIFIFRPKQQYLMASDGGNPGAYPGGVAWPMMPVQSVDQPLTKISTDMFEVVYSKRFFLGYRQWSDQATAVGLQASVKYKFMTIKLPVGKLTYADGVGQGSPVASSGFPLKPYYMWILSDSRPSAVVPPPPTAHPVVSCEATMHYIDL